MARNQSFDNHWSRPSVLVVLAGGALTVFFLIAIVREVLRASTVRRQVERLQQELANETTRASELEDLIGYLSSPTFQEREARLRLGLKKSGERVIVIPPTTTAGTASTGSAGTTNDQTPRRPASQWWQYFFGPTTSI